MLECITPIVKFLHTQSATTLISKLRSTKTSAKDLKYDIFQKHSQLSPYFMTEVYAIFLALKLKSSVVIPP